MRPEYISEADKREAWNNLIAFSKAFDEVEARHKARLSGTPPGASSSHKTSNYTQTGKTNPVLKPQSGQDTFSANKKER